MRQKDQEITDIATPINLRTITAKLYLNGETDDADDIALINPEDFFGVTFTNLLSNKVYNVVIVVEYDLFDGQGAISDFIVAEIEIMTVAKDLPTGIITNWSWDKDSITFDLEIIDNDNVISGNLKAVLYDDLGPTTHEITNIIIDLNQNLTFTGIDSNTEYTIRIFTDYYLNDESDEELSYRLDYQSITTEENEMVTAEILNVTLGKTEITFDVDVIDADLVSTTNLKAVLYIVGNPLPLQDTPVSIGNNPLKSFTGLLADSTYIIKIETDYNMKDGKGDFYSEELTSHTDVTKPLVSPTAEITIDTLYDTEILFDVLIIDDDDTITANLVAVLYDDINDPSLGSIALDIIANGSHNFIGLSFDGLEFGKEYTIQIETDYNLNSNDVDVEGETIDTETATTHQIIVLGNIDEGKKYISFSILTDDAFGIVTEDFIEIQLFDTDDNPVGDSITISPDFGMILLDLYSDNDYYIEVTATYNLGGTDITDVVYTHYFHSEPLAIPVIEILKDTIVVTGTDIIDLDIEVAEDLDSIIDANLIVYLYANGDNNIIIAQFALSEGVNSIQFTGLDTTANSYQIVVKADVDLNTDGLGASEYIFDEITFIIAV